MASTTPYELTQYYRNLLIFQYLNKPRASSTIGLWASLAIIPQTSVQIITLSEIPTSGSFTLSYNEQNVDPIDWDDTESDIQTKLRALDGLSEVVVVGAPSDTLMTITFTDVAPPAYPLLLESNSLMATSIDVNVSILEIDQTIPLAIQNAFNLVQGTSIAQGVQLDVIGKYCGVSRSGQGSTSFIVLDDSDFLVLIKMAIAQNSAGSSLADIQNFLFQFFNGGVLVYDYKNMTMTYVISQSVGSLDLIQLVITENLLPAPMAVRITNIFYPPSADLFSYRTYEEPAVNGVPYNTYEDYHMDWPFLTYEMQIVI